MKIVVTGALGHIGSALVRALPTDFPDAELVMVDNLMTQRYASLFNLPTGARYSFVDADVREADLVAIFKGADTVVHLAAMTDAAGSFDKAAAVEANNYAATEKVAKACLETGAALIHLSSTSVYGTQADKVDESCLEADLKPQSPYAETKLKEEALVRQLVDQGLRAVICRFGTIFGTSVGMRFHTAVNKFCWQAAMGLPITVWRTAYNQKRPYLDLTDALRAVTFLIRGGHFDGSVFNILTLNATVGDIVEAIKDVVPEAQVDFVDSPIMNQLSYDVSAQKFAGLGFEPSGNLPKSIRATIDLIGAANSDRKASAS